MLSVRVPRYWHKFLMTSGVSIKLARLTQSAACNTSVLSFSPCFITGPVSLRLSPLILTFLLSSFHCFFSLYQCISVYPLFLPLTLSPDRHFHTLPNRIRSASTSILITRSGPLETKILRFLPCQSQALRQKKKNIEKKKKNQCPSYFHYTYHLYP